MTFTSSYTPGLIQQSEYYYGTPEMTPGLSGSFSGSFQGDGSALTGISSTPFPFAGDGIISGSLLISSSNVGGVSTSSLTLQGSGSTIFEIQGSQGQLFSVTDDLIHDIFNVSDISGDTLLKVSGSGLVEIPVGNLSGSATSTASFGHYIGDGSQLTNIPSIYTSDGNILSTRTINDRAGGFTGTAGSNALKMNVRNSGALLVAGYQNNGNPGTTNHLIQWGPGATNGGMNVRGKLGLTGGGGRIDLTNSGGSQYFTVAQTGITSTVSLSATTITNNSAVADTKLTGSFTGSFVGDGSELTGISAFPFTGDAQITGSLLISGSKIHLRGESASPGPILELESINGGSGKDVYIKVGDSNENYAYVFGADDTGNTFRISSGNYSSATLGTNDKFIIDGDNIEFPAGNISGSITSTASFGHYLGDGSQLTNLPAATAGSTAGRVVFTTTNGELTTEAGFTYDATTDRLTVPNLTTTTFTASFITSSTIETSGSNIFGDDTTDTQTLIGTTKMTGSAQITGSLSLTGVTNALNFTNTNSTASVNTKLSFRHAAGNDYNSLVYFGSNYFRLNNSEYPNAAALYVNGRIQGSNFYAPMNSNGFNISSYNSRFTNNYLALYGSSGVTFGASNAGFATIRDGAAGTPSSTYDIDALLGIVSAGNSTGFGFKVHNSDDHETFAVQDNKKVIVSGSLEVSGSIRVKGQVTGSLTVESSGSTVFEVIGSQGTLFSIDDDLDGTLLNVKDRSGIPVLQASASGEIYLGQSPQSLYTTAVISSTTADVTQSLYSLDTSSYGGAFFDYIAHSGSNARGGTVSSVWTPGGSVVFSETTTTHIGDTSNLNLVVHFSQSQAQLACYADTSQYNIKIITRAI